ncbi:MAG: SMP-30/gluconolactonase/LRE family protein [bacterium]|nr:SMP-30/gluconolactonase/LRE family protein [bacterium]
MKVAFRYLSGLTSLTLTLTLSACGPAEQPRAEAALPAPSLVAAFDPMKGEFAEGLTLGKGGSDAYAATATGAILKIALADGSRSVYGNLPAPPSDGSVYVLGLAFDSSANLYVAVTSFGPKYKTGIYKVAPGGGAAKLFASGSGMMFPNGISVDSDDSLFVSDATGKIFKISKAGKIATWFAQPAFTAGDNSSPCKTGYNIGANGIALTSDTLYFSNSDRAALVKVGRKPDGSAGDATFLAASNCSTLRGADGIALGPDGKIYVASNQQGAVLAVAQDGSVSTVASGDLLDAFPSSVVFSAADEALYVVNAAFGEKKTPRLVKVPVGM